MLNFSYTPIDYPISIYTFPEGINAAGDIVGSFDQMMPGSHGFLFSAGTYTQFDVPGATGTLPNGINNAGQIVGAFAIAGIEYGFLLSHGSYTRFQVPNSGSTIPYRINDSGQIVGTFYDGTIVGPRRGFLLQDGNYTILDVPGATSTAALGINASGDIAGSYADRGPRHHGFLLRDGNYTTLDVPGAVATYPIGINDFGQIVGSYEDSAGKFHAFLLSDGVYTTLVPPHAVSVSAYDINDSGQIVGSGDAHGFLATPVAPAVTCSVAAPLLWPANRRLVNVGLSVTLDPPEARRHIFVYGDDNARPSDVADIDANTLRLRAERRGDGNGRVYLIVTTATDPGGTGVDVCTVAVPHDRSSRSIEAVQRQAAAAEAYYREFHTVPRHYRLLGEGPGGGTSPSADSETKDNGFAEWQLDPEALAGVRRSPQQVFTPSLGLVHTQARTVLPDWEAGPVDNDFADDQETYFVPRLRDGGLAEMEDRALDLLVSEDLPLG